MIHRTSLLKVGDPYSLLGLFEGGGRAQRMSGGFSARMSTQSLRGHCSQARANNNLRPLAADERKVLRKDAPENFSGALLAAREQNNPENFAGLDQHGVSAIRPKSAPGSGTVPFGRSHGALMSTEIAIPSAPSGVSTFTFDGHAIRVVDREGDPWFVTKDVTATLGLTGSATNTSNHMRYLREDERAVLTKEDYFLYCPSLFTGSASRIAVISEAGLYKLILRANASPTATAFQNWVTRDVIPTIRKSGAYVAGQEALAPAQQAEMAAMVADLVARMGVLLDREESRQKAVG